MRDKTSLGQLRLTIGHALLWDTLHGIITILEILVKYIYPTSHTLRGIKTLQVARRARLD